MHRLATFHSGSVEDGGHDSGPTAPVTEDRARLAWERRAEWPLTVAAVVFLAAYAWPILDPSIAPSAAAVCDVVVWGTWWLFAIDYVVRLVLANSRWRFVRGSFVDLITVVLPILRPLRLLRLITILSVLNRYAGDSLRGRVALYVAGSVGLTIAVASLAVLEAERDVDRANILSIGDALWWAVTTMTTSRLRRPIPGHRHRSTCRGRPDADWNCPDRRGDRISGFLVGRSGEGCRSRLLRLQQGTTLPQSPPNSPPLRAELARGRQLVTTSGLRRVASPRPRSSDADGNARRPTFM